MLKCSVTYSTRFTLFGTMKKPLNNTLGYWNENNIGKKMFTLFKLNSIPWITGLLFHLGFNNKCLCLWMTMLTLTVKTLRKSLANGKIMLLVV